MTEQTANLCTTDAAESLREIVAERDREIERLKEGQSILILARDEQKRLANEYRDLWSRASLKAQPSGVVDSQRLLDWNRSQPEPRPIVVGREYQVAEACARLNQQPASGGDDAERAAFEAWHRDKFKTKYCTGQPTRDKHNGVYADHYGPKYQQEMWEAWQARAALSAPSHGEQVREWIPVGERLPDRGQGTVAVLTEEGDTLTAWASYWSGASDAFASWSFPHLDDDDSVVTHWMPLPAAPSAGSQKQGE